MQQKVFMGKALTTQLHLGINSPLSKILRWMPQLVVAAFIQYPVWWFSSADPPAPLFCGGEGSLVLIFHRAAVNAAKCSRCTRWQQPRSRRIAEKSESALFLRTLVP
jgi:hypothetical protein